MVKLNFGKYLLSPVGVLVLSIAAVVFISWQFHTSLAVKDQLRFQTRVELAHNNIQSRIETYVAMLNATAGFFAASQEVTLEEFKAYTSRLELQKTYPGIQGIGLSLRLKPGTIESFEEKMRAGGVETFHVWPEGPWEERHTIVYLEPMDERNREAIGYDMFSEPIRRKAMEVARDSAEPRASGRVTLVQEITEDVQAGFLIYVPIYRNGAAPSTLEGRRDNLIGYVYSPFRVADLLQGVFGRNSPLAIDFDIYDEQSEGPESRLYRSLDYNSGNPPDFKSRFNARRTLMVAGRQWTVVYKSSARFDESSNRYLAPIVFVSGILLSFLLTAITWFEAKAREESERVAAELRRSEHQLSENRERLLENDRRKDEFLATLAHELRNPLAPIYNSLQVMKMSGIKSEPFNEFSGIMENQIEQLVRLVDDLMDVSRITRGKIHLRPEQTSLQKIIENVLQVVGPMLDDKNQSFNLELSDQPVWMEVDFARVSQIFVNLISNASKYTPKGGRIRVSAFEESHFIKVIVEDDGMGIAPENIDKIFDAFTQVDNTISRSQGGLGIGLMLVRRLAEMHGGRIEVYSEGEGKGSTFVVFLPCVKAGAFPETEIDTLSEKRLEGRRQKILIVDDNKESALTLAQAMEIQGHEVRYCTNAQDSLTIAKTFGPDVLLLDLGMPGMSGYDLCRIMRKDPELHNALFIAQTGWGQEKHRAMSREAGFHFHLVKPVNISELVEIIDSRRVSGATET